MKILRVTTEINRSSIGRTTEQLGKLVIAEGWESYIAYGRTNGTSLSKKIKIGNQFEVYIHVLLTRLFDLHGYGSYFATKRFVKELKQINPDLIHLHAIHGYYINLDVLFSYLKKSGIPVVWTHHDCWSFTGHCGFYSEVGCEKWKTRCGCCPISQEYPSSLFFDRSKQEFDHKKTLFTALPNVYNVGVSQWICDEIKQSFMGKYPTIRIYNGIDTDIFMPYPENANKVREKYNLGNEILLTAVATAWSERKGLSDYLKLRKRLSNKYTLVFVGVPKELSPKLPKGIVGIPRTDNIRELVDIYSASSIVMNLAGAESFGKTTPEGLACGVPSIVYNCTASSELVDKKTGVVVEKGDIDGVLKAIETISRWDKKETSTNCRNRACELFSIEKNWPMYIELYKKILMK